MEVVTVVKALAFWVIIALLAIINGGVREFALIPVFGKRTGFMVSGLLLSVLILVVTYISLPWLNIDNRGVLIGVGCGWLLLTLVFECSFGLLRGVPLKEILQAYTFKGGNIWPIVLLVTALAPWVSAWMRGWLSVF